MRRFLTALVLGGAVLVAGCMPPQTPTPPTTHAQAVTQVVDRFSADFRSGNWDGVVNVIPPQLLQMLLLGTAVSPAEIKREVAREMGAAMASVEIEHFNLDTAAATYAETPTGRPYGLIPSTMVMDAPGMGKVRIESITLAILEKGKWYILRPDDFGHDDSFHKVYPDFQGIRFPQAKITKLASN